MAAVDATVEFINKVMKFVMVRETKATVAKASKDFVELADVSGYVLAVVPSDKGLVPKQHPHFIRTYMEIVSTTFCAEIMELAYTYLFVGPTFNDYRGESS